jgi:hypothetical protein
LRTIQAAGMPALVIQDHRDDGLTLRCAVDFSIAFKAG